MAFRYDCAVVGSSPLLLMMALQLSRGGRTVVLFEAEDRLGGAWQVEEVDGVGLVECACHLLEWYVGGYELLAELSGMPFVPSIPQPVRVLPSGEVLPYMSRGGVARSLYWSLRRVLGAIVRRALAKGSQRASTNLALDASLRHLAFELRYRTLGIVAFDAVRRPAEGFIGFIATLCRQVEHSAIDVLKERISEIDIRGDHAILFYGDQIVEATEVFIGESTHFSEIDPSAMTALEEYHHIVVGLPADGVILRSDYVHLPEDPLFHRITYVRDCTVADNLLSAIFLVQLRKPISEIDDINKHLDVLFRRCKIALSASGVVVHKVFSKQYMKRNVLDAPPQAKLVVRRLRTIGDLARNVLLHARDFGLSEKRRSQER